MLRALSTLSAVEIRGAAGEASPAGTWSAAPQGVQGDTGCPFAACAEREDI
jgi:hypothetical protein